MSLGNPTGTDSHQLLPWRQGLWGVPESPLTPRTRSFPASEVSFSGVVCLFVCLLKGLSCKLN